MMTKLTLRIAATLLAGVILAACDDGVAAPDIEPTIVFESAGLELDAVGGTERLSVTGNDENGQPLSAEILAWTSSDAAVATVEEDGTVTARGEGDAIITAAYAGATATVTVRVRPLVTFRISLESALNPIVNAGTASDSARLEIQARP